MMSVLTSLTSLSAVEQLLSLLVWHSGQSPGPIFQALNKLCHVLPCDHQPFPSYVPSHLGETGVQEAQLTLHEGHTSLWG